MKTIQLSSHTRPIVGVNLTEEGDLMFAHSKDGFCSVWYTKNGERLGTFIHGGAVFDCAVDKNTKYLLTACADCHFYIWEALTGRLIRKEPIFNKGSGEINEFARCVSIDFAVGGKKFLVNWYGRRKNYINLYDFDPELIEDSNYALQPYLGQLILKDSGGRGHVMWGANNDFILASGAGKLERWDLLKPESRILGKLFGHESSIPSIILGFLDQARITAERRDESIRDTTTMSYNADKTLILVPSTRTASIYDVASLQCLQKFECDKSMYHVNAARFVPGFDLVALTGGIPAQIAASSRHVSKFHVQFFHIATCELIGEMRTGHFSPLNTLEFHNDPDGNKLVMVTGAEEGNCRIFQFSSAFKKKYHQTMDSMFNIEPNFCSPGHVASNFPVHSVY